MFKQSLVEYYSEKHFQMVSLEVNLFLVPFNIYKTSYNFASDNSSAGALSIRTPQCFLDVTTYFRLCDMHDIKTYMVGP